MHSNDNRTGLQEQTVVTVVHMTEKKTKSKKVKTVLTQIGVTAIQYKGVLRRSDRHKWQLKLWRSMSTICANLSTAFNIPCVMHHSSAKSLRLQFNVTRLDNGKCQIEPKHILPVRCIDASVS